MQNQFHTRLGRRRTELGKDEIGGTPSGERTARVQIDVSRRGPFVKRKGKRTGEKKGGGGGQENLFEKGPWSYTLYGNYIPGSVEEQNLNIPDSLSSRGSGDCRRREWRNESHEKQRRKIGEVGQKNLRCDSSMWEIGL